MKTGRRRCGGDVAAVRKGKMEEGKGGDDDEDFPIRQNIGNGGQEGRGEKRSHPRRDFMGSEIFMDSLIDSGYSWFRRKMTEERIRWGEEGGGGGNGGERNRLTMKVMVTERGKEEDGGDMLGMNGRLDSGTNTRGHPEC